MACSTSRPWRARGAPAPRGPSAPASGLAAAERTCGRSRRTDPRRRTARASLLRVIVRKPPPAPPPKFTFHWPGRRPIRRPASRRAGLLVHPPVRSQLVVFLPLVGIAEHFVGLVDLLEFRFGRLVAGIDVGMVLPRQLPERLLDLLLGRGLGDAERRVVVLEIHRPLVSTVGSDKNLVNAGMIFGCSSGRDLFTSRPHRSRRAAERGQRHGDGGDGARASESGAAQGAAIRVDRRVRLPHHHDAGRRSS